ncbi:MAG: 50S ribosomal protein L6 [Nitrososphaera sp.]
MATSTEEAIVGEVEIPDSVKVTQERNTIVAKGKAGTVKKDFTKLPATISIDGNKVVIKPHGKRKKDLAVTNTGASIIRSMIKGAEKGFTYKLKVIFAHFPISVKVKDGQVLVENFFGERSPRVSTIVGEGTKVTVAGEDILVQGPSLEDVSQTAANIELSTKIKDKDQRVFLDGLYVYAREDGMQRG